MEAAFPVRQVHAFFFVRLDTHTHTRFVQVSLFSVFSACHVLQKSYRRGDLRAHDACAHCLEAVWTLPKHVQPPSQDVYTRICSKSPPPRAQNDEKILLGVRVKYDFTLHASLPLPPSNESKSALKWGGGADLLRIRV